MIMQVACINNLSLVLLWSKLTLNVACDELCVIRRRALFYTGSPGWYNDTSPLTFWTWWVIRTVLLVTSSPTSIPSGRRPSNLLSDARCNVIRTTHQTHWNSTVHGAPGSWYLVLLPGASKVSGLTKCTQNHEHATRLINWFTSTFPSVECTCLESKGSS